MDSIRHGYVQEKEGRMTPMLPLFCTTKLAACTHLLSNDMRPKRFLSPEGSRSRLNSCETPVSGDQASRKTDPENAHERLHVCHFSAGARVHPRT